MRPAPVGRWRSLLSLGSVGLLAIAPSPQKPDPHHPAALVGQWVDVRHTSATDSMVWVLGANGDDGTLEIRVGVDGSHTEHRRHYGRWRLDGDLADSVHRALCFVHRPGRQGASCIAFRLDTLTGAAGSRGHLVLQNYRGAHHVLDRELVARVTK